MIKDDERSIINKSQNLIDSSTQALPKIGNSEVIKPVVTKRRLGKSNRTYDQRLSVIAERSPKSPKKQAGQIESQQLPKIGAQANSEKTF